MAAGGGKHLALRVEPWQKLAFIECVILLLGDLFSFARSMVMFGYSLCNTHM